MNEKSQNQASCGIENFEFIVSERVKVNPGNSLAMSALTFSLFKLNTLQKKSSNFESDNDSGALKLHHDNEVKEVVSPQPSISWYKSANQKIGVRTMYES